MRQRVAAAVGSRTVARVFIALLAVAALVLALVGAPAWLIVALAVTSIALGEIRRKRATASTRACGSG